jgi:hypothetical protein
MLGKMLIHGLVAAAIIGSAAAVYAQAKDNGYLKPEAIQTQPAAPTAKAARVEDRKGGTTGYLAADVARDGERHHAKKEHRREGRRHDDDDDD